MSNENFKSAIHRVVTHSEEARTTISVFVVPSNNFIIEPARALINAHNPAVYRAYLYKEFFSTFKGKGCEAETTLECFRVLED